MTCSGPRCSWPLVSATTRSPGGIVVSSVVRDLSIGKGFTFGPGVAATLKGFPVPVSLCELSWSAAG